MTFSPPNGGTWAGYKWFFFQIMVKLPTVLTAILFITLQAIQKEAFQRRGILQNPEVGRLLIM